MAIVTASVVLALLALGIVARFGLLPGVGEMGAKIWVGAAGAAVLIEGAALAKIYAGR